MEQTSAGAKPKLSTTAELISGSVNDYLKNWQKFAYLLIVPLTISFIASFASFALSNFAADFTWPWQLTVASILVYLVFLAAVGVLFVLTSISEFLLIKDLSQEVSFNNLKSWYGRALPYLWISLGISVIYTILALLGIVLLVVPGVIFLVTYSFAIYAVIFEGQKFEGAFGRSRDLVKGYWWPVFGRFVAGIVVIYATYLVIGGIYAGIIWLIGFVLHLKSTKDLFQLMYDLLSIYVGMVIGPLSMIYAYKIFRQLADRNPAK